MIAKEEKAATKRKAVRRLKEMAKAIVQQTLRAERYLQSHRQCIKRAAHSMRRLHAQMEEGRRRITLPTDENHKWSKVQREAEDHKADARRKAYLRRRAEQVESRRNHGEEDTTQWEVPITQKEEDDTDQWCVIGHGCYRSN